MDQRSTEQPPPPASSNARSAFATSNATGARLSLLQKTKDLISSRFQKTKELLTSEQTRRGSNMEMPPENKQDSKVIQKTKEFLSASVKSAGKATEAVVSVSSQAVEQVKQLDAALSVQISQYAAQLLERMQGKLPSAEQLSQLSRAISQRLERAIVFGQPLPDFLAGALTGAAVKQTARWGLAVSGAGSFPAAAAAGAAAGATSAGAREYLRQRRELKVQETEQTDGIKAKLKSEFRMLKAADKQRIGKAMARGAVWGAVGGVVGATVVDFIHGGEGIHEVQEKVGQAFEAIREKAGPTAGLIKEKGTEALNALGKSLKPDTTPVPSPAEAITAQSLPEQIASPEVIHLPAGSNPWQEVAEKLKNDLHRDPTNAEILAADKIVSSRSNIAVPSWGIQGENLHTQPPVGYALNFDEPYNKFVQETLDAKSGVPAPEVSSPAELHQAPPATAPPTEVTTHTPVVTPTPVPIPHEGISTPANTPVPIETLSPQHPPPVRLPTPSVTETVQPPIHGPETAAPTPIGSQTEIVTLPHQIETINLTPDVLATWPGVPEYLRNYLEQNLGRKVTEAELEGAIDLFRAGNPIDPSKIPSGVEFKLSSINQYILKIKNG